MTAKKTKTRSRSTVKKKAAATPQKPKAAPSKNGTKHLAEARKILPLLRAGKTTMGAERDRLGFSSNRPLRMALIEILGSRKAYFTLLKSSQAAARKK